MARPRTLIAYVSDDSKRDLEIEEWVKGRPNQSEAIKEALWRGMAYNSQFRFIESTIETVLERIFGDGMANAKVDLDAIRQVVESAIDRKLISQPSQNKDDVVDQEIANILDELNDNLILDILD